MTLVSAIVLLFMVIDPFGNIPFFVTALNQVEASRHRHVMLRELTIAYVVMVVFLFAGQTLLGTLGISEPALAIAGGVILFLIALRMVFPPPKTAQHQEAIDGEPFIVPLAIPYIAGPSVLAVEMLLMSGQPERWATWLLAVTIAWLATAVIVVLGAKVTARLGPKGLVAIERLMGMILVAISIQMLLDGIETYFSH